MALARSQALSGLRKFVIWSDWSEGVDVGGLGDQEHTGRRGGRDCLAHTSREKPGSVLGFRTVEVAEGAGSCRATSHTQFQW